MTTVIACHCAVVRADDIRTEVRLGATTVAEVAARCGAAAKCGGCLPTVTAVLEEERVAIASLRGEGAATTAVAVRR